MLMGGALWVVLSKVGSLLGSLFARVPYYIKDLKVWKTTLMKAVLGLRGLGFRGQGSCSWSRFKFSREDPAI